MTWCRQATSHYLSQFGHCLFGHVVSQGHNEVNIIELFFRKRDNITYLLSVSVEECFWKNVWWYPAPSSSAAYHIYASMNWVSIGSDNGLSPVRRQAVIETNAGILLIGTLGTNFSEILIEILTFSFKKMRLRVSSAKRRPFYLGLNVPVTKLITKLNVSSFILGWFVSSVIVQLYACIFLDSDLLERIRVSRIGISHTYLFLKL